MGWLTGGSQVYCVRLQFLMRYKIRSGQAQGLSGYQEPQRGLKNKDSFFVQLCSLLINILINRDAGIDTFPFPNKAYSNSNYLK